MNQTHIENLLAVRANLRGAIFSRRTVSIDGGTFGPDEMRSLLLAVEGALISERDNGSEYVREYLRSVSPKLGGKMP